MTKICFDSERVDRIGLPEAVFCEGKPKESIEALLQRFNRTSGHPVLFTRLQPEVFASFPLDVQQGVDYHPLSRTAFGSTLEPVSHGRVAVVSAGTSDAPVAWKLRGRWSILGLHTRCLRTAVLLDCGGSHSLLRRSTRAMWVSSSPVLMLRWRQCLGDFVPNLFLRCQLLLATALQQVALLRCRACFQAVHRALE